MSGIKETRSTKLSTDQTDSGSLYTTKLGVAERGGVAFGCPFEAISLLPQAFRTLAVGPAIATGHQNTLIGYLSSIPPVRGPGTPSRPPTAADPAKSRCFGVSDEQI